MATQVAKRLLTIDEYYSMADAGIIGREDRVELIRGEIVQMSPIGSLHASVVDSASQLFFDSVAGNAIVRVQNPIRLETQQSEPEPDISLLRPRQDRYRTAHPTPEDILLVVEVSDSSLEYDRGVKIPLYAEAGIPEVWLIVPDEDGIERYADLSGGEYRRMERFHLGDALAPTLLPNAQVQASALLGMGD